MSVGHKQVTWMQCTQISKEVLETTYTLPPPPILWHFIWPLITASSDWTSPDIHLLCTPCLNVSEILRSFLHQPWRVSASHFITKLTSIQCFAHTQLRTRCNPTSSSQSKHPHKCLVLPSSVNTAHRRSPNILFSPIYLLIYWWLVLWSLVPKTHNTKNLIFKY